MFQSGICNIFSWFPNCEDMYILDTLEPVSRNPPAETFWARKAIFSSSVSKNGELYTPETSWMKGNSVRIKNMWIKQLCKRVRDFAMSFRERKRFGTFEKRSTGETSKFTWEELNCNSGKATPLEISPFEFRSVELRIWGSLQHAHWWLLEYCRY